MDKFEFSIIASGLDPTSDDFDVRFFEAGCDDATVSFQKGHIILDFARRASTVEDAIGSAIEDVRRAGATVDRIEPDPLVSLSDIASRASLTRAALTQYAKGQRGGGFPPPAVRVTSNSPLWSWAAVAVWLMRKGRLRKEVAAEAEAIERANNALSRPDHARAKEIA